MGQGSLKGAHGSGELEGLMGKWSLKGTHGSVKGHWSRTSHHYPLLLLRSTRTPLSASMLVDDHAAMMVEDHATKFPETLPLEPHHPAVHHRQRHDGYDDDDDGRPHHSPSSSSSEGRKSSPAIMGESID